jgi:hypothetical protein
MVNKEEPLVFNGTADVNHLLDIETEDNMNNNNLLQPNIWTQDRTANMYDDSNQSHVWTNGKRPVNTGNWNNANIWENLLNSNNNSNNSQPSVNTQVTHKK